MSRKHGHSKHRRRRHPAPLCPRCLTPAGTSPAAALSAVAAALNAAEAAGVRVRLRHGIAVTRHGYVLPLKGGRWTARTLAYDPLSPLEDPAGDGMDE